MFFDYKVGKELEPLILTGCCRRHLKSDDACYLTCKLPIRNRSSDWSMFTRFTIDNYHVAVVVNFFLDPM
jgi:hypothetical protein